MLFNDIFPDVYVINRHNDQQRQEIFEKNFKETGIEYKFKQMGPNPIFKFITDFFNSMTQEEFDNVIVRINKAFKNDTVDPIFKELMKKDLKMSSYMGVTSAHLDVIRLAQANDLPHVFIFENDAIPLKNFNERVEPYLKTIPANWDFLSFGCSFHHWTDINTGNLLTWANEECMKSETWAIKTFSFNLPGYAVKKTLYDHILNFYEKGNYFTIDYFLSNLHSLQGQGFLDEPVYGKYNFYMTRGNIFQQNPYLPTFNKDMAKSIEESTKLYINEYGVNSLPIEEYENCLTTTDDINIYELQ